MVGVLALVGLGLAVVRGGYFASPASQLRVEAVDANDVLVLDGDTLRVGSRDLRLRRHIGYALNGLGARIVTTGKSSVLLVEVLDHDFDLVILDTDIEGMNGQETLGILRQMRPRLPVLFLHRAEDDVTEAVREGGGRIGTLARNADEGALMKAVERLVLKASDRETRVSSS